VNVLKSIWRTIRAALRLGRKPAPPKTEDDEPAIYPMW
jgi:hypothetical protein